MLNQISYEMHSGWGHYGSQMGRGRILHDFAWKCHLEVFLFGGKSREQAAFG